MCDTFASEVRPNNKQEQLLLSIIKPRHQSIATVVQMWKRTSDEGLLILIKMITAIKQIKMGSIPYFPEYAAVIPLL